MAKGSFGELEADVEGFVDRDCGLKDGDVFGPEGRLYVRFFLYMYYVFSYMHGM